MTKRKMITRLLVVVAFAGCEEIAPPAPVSTTPVPATTGAVATPAATSGAIAAPAATSGATTAPATPRTTPDGRPACGNVTGRSARATTTNCRPRVLRDDRPAPGNVTSRNPAPVSDEGR
jgi:hypothetical protein